MKTERELFEKAIKSFWVKRNVNFDKLVWLEVENRYKADSLQFKWELWQASANREGYKLVPVEPSRKQWGGLARHIGRYMQMHDRYCPKTLKKYFDRFIGEPPKWLSEEVGDWDSDNAFTTADLPVFIYKAMIEDVNE